MDVTGHINVEQVITQLHQFPETLGLYTVEVHDDHDHTGNKTVHLNKVFHNSNPWDITWIKERQELNLWLKLFKEKMEADHSGKLLRSLQIEQN